MTALSAGILIFLVLMLSIAASINYLRDRRDRRNDRSLRNGGGQEDTGSQQDRRNPGGGARYNTGNPKDKNNVTGGDGLNEASGLGLHAGKSGDKEKAMTDIPADARAYAKLSPAKAAAVPKPAAAKQAKLKSVATKPAPLKSTYSRKYRAVSVRPQLGSCRAVLVFQHIRFLAEEAPHFPVPGCNAESCRCQYIYHADRREEDRRSSFGIARGWTPLGGGERRRTDRRRDSV